MLTGVPFLVLGMEAWRQTPRGRWNFSITIDQS